MGDKAQAKRELRAADVPLVPGTDGGASLEGRPRRGATSSATRSC